MKSHLETFNDGVIAIIITIMVLELPIPSGPQEYKLFLSSIGLFFVSFFMIIGNLEYDPGAAIVSSLLLTFMGAPAVVLSIVFGIKSISLFKKSTGKRPIPALALGIGGVVLSGIGAFFMLIMLLVSMAAF